MKKSLSYLAIILACAQFISCGKSTDNSKKNTKKNYVDHKLVNKSELDTWLKMETIVFQTLEDSTAEKHTVDLKSRNTRIDAENYVLGRLNDSIWVSPSLSAFNGRSAKFYHNLWFYFYCLPYVLQDPGVFIQPLTPSSIQDTLYNRYKVTFDSGVGDAPKDQYILHLDTGTKELKYLLYSVTFFDTTRSEKYNAIAYRDWITIEGLRFPKKLVGYQWKNDSLGQIRYQTEINLISLKKERLPTSYYRPVKPFEIEN